MLYNFQYLKNKKISKLTSIVVCRDKAQTCANKHKWIIFECGESIKDFLTLVFWDSVLGVSFFVTSDDLINRG